MTPTELLIELLKGFYASCNRGSACWSYVEETSISEIEGFSAFKKGFDSELRKFCKQHNCKPYNEDYE